MKNLKRLMSVVLSVVMLMSFVVSTSAATFADVAETDAAYEAVEVLAALEILEGKDAGNFDPEGNIKRSEMAAIICRARNAEGAALGAASFSDVPAGHWAANYIGWAASEQIIKGRGDGTFDPDANVSYNEAIAMIVRAMGFEYYVTNFTSGFPNGYAQVASGYKIDKGVNISNGNAAATRANVALMLYNAFDAPLMATKTVSFEPEYIIYDGSKSADYEMRTLLSWYSDIYKIRATVEDTSKSDKTLVNNRGEKQIKFTVAGTEKNSLYGFTADDIEKALDLALFDKDGKAKTLKVIADNDAWAAYQGYEVVLYVALNEKDNAEVVAMVANTSAVDEKILDNALIDELSISGKKVTMKYKETEDARAKTVDFANEVSLYVNGMFIAVLDGGATADAAKDALDAFNAIKAVDSPYSDVTLLGKDDEYDKIYLTKYVYGVVEDVDVEGEKITTDKRTFRLSEEKTSEEFVYNIYKDGAKIELSDLAEGDLLNVVIGDKTLNNKIDASTTFVDIYVTNNVIESSVKYRSGDGNADDPYVYTIDGEDYYAVPGSGLTMSAGDAGSFIITKDGFIYDVEYTSTASDNYAFIIDLARISSGFGSTWQVRLLDKNNNLRTLNVASKVNVTWDNGTKYERKSYKDEDQDTIFDDVQDWVRIAKDDTNKVPADAVDELATNIKKRLVTFKEVNEEITELVFINGLDTPDDKDFVSSLLNNKSYDEDTASLGDYDVLDSVVLFNIPGSKVTTKKDDTNAEYFLLDETKMQIYGAGSLADGKKYNGYIYDEDEDGTFAAAVLTNTMDFAGSVNALAVVMSTSLTTDADGNESDAIKFFQNGETKTLVVNSNSNAKDVLDGVVAGDIFQYTVDGNGDINDAEVVFNYVKDGQSVLKSNDPDSDVQYFTGLVTKNDANNVSLQDANGSFKKRWNLEDGCTNVLFDTTVDKNKAIEGYDDTDYIEGASFDEANGNRFDSDAYVVVVRTVNNKIVDVVAYMYGEDKINTKTATEFIAAYIG